MTRELVRIPDFVEGCVGEHALCAAASAAAAAPTAAAAAAVCARRRAAETREAMMSRSGCKESKVAAGAFAAPTRQHQHTPSEYGRRTRSSERPAPSPRRGNGKRSDITAGNGGRMMVPLFVIQTQKWHLLTERFFDFFMTNLMFLHLRINRNALIWSGRAPGHAQGPPPT